MKRLPVLLTGTALLLSTLVVVAPRVRAQDDDKAAKPDSLEKKQKAIAEAYKQLEDALNQSATSFQRTEPEKANRIRAAFEASKHAFEGEAQNSTRAISDRMHDILDMLSKHDAATKTLVVENQVIEALENVLALLEADDRKAAERLDPKRIEALLEEVKKLIQQQKEHKTQVEKARDLEAIARAMADASKKLDDVYQAQKELAGKTGDAKPEELAQLAKTQREIADQAGELAKPLDAVSELKTGENAAEPKPGEAKPGEGKPSAGEGKPSAGEGKPSAGEGKPSAGEGKPSAGEGKPSAGEGKPSAGGGKPSPGDARPATDPKTPATDPKTPATDPKTPATDQKTPATDQKTPATDQKTPATDQKTPATDQKTPATDQKTPATDQKTPAGEGKPGEAGQPGSPSASAASKAVASAKGAMQDAAKGLDDQKKDEALERERKALEDLEAAKTALDKKRQQIERLAQLDRAKAEQDRLRQQTADLAKRMGEQPPQGQQDQKPEEGKPQDGKPQDGKGGQPKPGGKSGQSKSSGKSQGAVPGKRNVERAEEEQKRAGDDLENRYVKDASEKEEDAIQQLKEAEAKMREALVQARKREQEELLKTLGSQFVEMLAKQRELTKKTEALDKERLAPLANVAGVDTATAPRPELTRRQAMECAGIATGEGELRDQAERANELVTEEGSSTILPTVINEVKEDLTRLNELLEKRDTGRFVVSLQHDVERSLEELIEVIKKEIEERKGGGGGGGGGGGDGKSNDPLLPASAELKMIKAQQLRVNTKTKEFDVGRGQAEADLTPDQREACRHIAEKEARVADFTRRLHLKLNKQEQ